ncbi:zinc finger BED domain-containing protein RICESLEEPER 2-like protein, partial [Tanacetum coccineum]
MYQEEKDKLHETLQKNIGRVSLTTNRWTSGKQKSYMALTTHFIDNEWNLGKKVLNFRKLDGHHGDRHRKRGRKWNSTNAMLEVAHVYEDAFARYDLKTWILAIILAAK